ncbi:MAG: DUF2510 domain-containing protein [Actinomycetales bacterium]|nr:DUF2510 domain-containing protein [Actinomycetales bacterium]
MSEPGWYPHPQKPNTLQYWDGQAWIHGPSNALARNSYIVAFVCLPVAAWFVHLLFDVTSPNCASITRTAITALLAYAAVFVVPLLIALAARLVPAQRWKTRLYAVALVWGGVVLLQSPLMVFGSFWAGMDC